MREKTHKFNFAIRSNTEYANWIILWMPYVYEFYNTVCMKTLKQLKSILAFLILHKQFAYIFIRVYIRIV